VILLADLDDAVLTLQEPSTFTAFHVAVAGGEVDDDRLAEVLAPHGRLDDGHAWIGVDAVVALAGDVVDDDWRAGFDAMVGYARDNGFLSPDGTELRAHVKHA
jgi:hypothetical protein